MEWFLACEKLPISFSPEKNLRPPTLFRVALFGWPCAGGAGWRAAAACCRLCLPKHQTAPRSPRLVDDRRGRRVAATLGRPRPVQTEIAAARRRTRADISIWSLGCTYSDAPTR